MTPQIIKIDFDNASRKELKAAVKADNDHFHYVVDRDNYPLVAVPIDAEIWEVFGDYFLPRVWYKAYGKAMVKKSPSPV